MNAVNLSINGTLLLARGTTEVGTAVQWWTLSSSSDSDPDFSIFVVSQPVAFAIFAYFQQSVYAALACGARNRCLPLIRPTGLQFTCSSLASPPHASERWLCPTSPTSGCSKARALTICGSLPSAFGSPGMLAGSAWNLVCTSS